MSNSYIGVVEGISASEMATTVYKRLSAVLLGIASGITIAGFSIDPSLYPLLCAGVTISTIGGIATLGAAVYNYNRTEAGAAYIQVLKKKNNE